MFSTWRVICGLWISGRLNWRRQNFCKHNVSLLLTAVELKIAIHGFTSVKWSLCYGDQNSGSYSTAAKLRLVHANRIISEPCGGSPSSQNANRRSSGNIPKSEKILTFLTCFLPKWLAVVEMLCYEHPLAICFVSTFDRPDDCWNGKTRKNSDPSDFNH